MIINLRWTQLISGLDENILTKTSTPLPYVPDCLITWIRKFLNKIEGSFDIEQEVLPPRNSTEDKGIMNMIIREVWTKSEISSINNTRISLKIFWLSDIIDPHSPKILPYFIFLPSEQPSMSTLKWPQHEPVTPKEIKLWRKALHTCVTPYLKQIKRPITWLPHHARGRIWRDNIFQNNEKFYINTPHGIFHCNPRRRLSISITN